MALSKKNKLILSWTLPPLFVIMSGGIAASVIITSEVIATRDINKFPNIKPESFSSIEDSVLNKLEYNPKKFDFDFFFWNVARTSRVNSVFKFQGATFNEKQNVWSKDGATYSIIHETVEYTKEGGSYLFNFEILKTANNFSIKYKSSTTISESLFQTKAVSQTNFLNQSADIISNLFNEGKMQVVSNLLSASSITDFKSPSDLTINANSTSVLASSFAKNETTNKYLSKNKSFLYGTNEFESSSFVNFQIPVVGKIFSAEDYKVDNKGLITNDSKIYKDLEAQMQNGSLTYLPELTAEESAGLQSNEITKRRIQKLIFDPSKLPFNVVNNQKLPLNNMQAILIKIELGNKSTWIVTWTNLLTFSAEVIKKAPELDLVVKRKGDVNATYLVWNELEKPENYKYFKTVSTPTNNLRYEVTNVSFSSDDVNKKNANVTVKISHPDLEEFKTYKKVVSKGFWSKTYKELHDQVSTLTSSFTDLSKASPTVSLKKDVTYVAVINNLNNLDWLEKNLTFTKPTGFTQNVQYKVVAAADLGGDKGIQFRLLLSSVSDPNNYLTYNGINLEIIGTLKKTTKQNNLVFLDS